MNIYPWQKNSWGELFFNESKMAHAYIFYGTQIEEVNKFASEVVRSVLCSNISKEKFACGACQNCVWSKANHPDLKIVDSNFDRDETLKTDIINIANVRDAIKFLEITSHQPSGKKILVVYDANRLNIAASNALLKTIEEPPNNCLIIFTVNNLANLLPTIISRCRLISFLKPSIEDATEFLKETNNFNLIDNLQLYNNSPLQLISEKEMLANINIIINELKKGKRIDLMQINNIWLSNGLTWIINLLQKWSYELLLCKLSNSYSYFPKEIKAVQELASNADLSKLLTYQKTLNKIKSYAESKANKEINLGSVMIEYKKIFKH
jgi:DNA polymerase-3 subunit delta'